MRQLTSVMLLTFVLFVNTGFAQQTESEKLERQQQVTEMMQDSSMRSMIMEHITQDPQMRRQMMQHMRESMKGGRGMMRQGMHRVMQDSAMKAHMQEHRKMMRAMMDNPKMRQHMMEMHMKCMEMMHGDSTMMDKDTEMEHDHHRQQ